MTVGGSTRGLADTVGGVPSRALARWARQPRRERRRSAARLAEAPRAVPGDALAPRRRGARPRRGTPPIGAQVQGGRPGGCWRPAGGRVPGPARGGSARRSRYRAGRPGRAGRRPGRASGWRRERVASARGALGRAVGWTASSHRRKSSTRGPMGRCRQASRWAPPRPRSRATRSWSNQLAIRRSPSAARTGSLSLESRTLRGPWALQSAQVMRPVQRASSWALDASRTSRPWNLSTMLAKVSALLSVEWRKAATLPGRTRTSSRSARLRWTRSESRELDMGGSTRARSRRWRSSGRCHERPAW